MSIQSISHPGAATYLPDNQQYTKIVSSPKNESATDQSIEDRIRQAAIRPRPEILYNLPLFVPSRRCSIVPSFIKQALSSIRQTLSQRKPTPPSFILYRPQFILASDASGGQRWNYRITKFDQYGNTLFLTFEHDGPQDASIVFKYDPEWETYENLKKRTCSIHAIKQEGGAKAEQPTVVSAILDLPAGETRAMYSFILPNGKAENFISRPQIRDQVCNPDLQIIDASQEIMRYSWDCTIKEMDYDLKTNTATIDIEHDGPENAEIVLQCDCNWLKTVPPQKPLFIHLPKTLNAEPSQIRRKARIEIDFNHMKYCKPLTSHGAFTIRFCDSNGSDNRIFLRSKTNQYLDDQEKFWANIIAIK